MILTITYEKNNATDLGYLLHKNPYRPQCIDFNYGKVNIFYPEISDEKCTIAMMLDVSSVNLVRKSKNSIFDYVNDRPYTASSFFSVALAKVFGTALSGICNKRPDLVNEKAKIKAEVIMVPCNDEKSLIQDFFASKPLNYKVDVKEFVLDNNHQEWGMSDYYNITLEKETTIKELLQHLYILIPSLNDEKHYYVDEDEIGKLEKYGDEWLKAHPYKDKIVSRYLIKNKSLINEAINRLNYLNVEKKENKKKVRLDKVRIDTVVNEINNISISSMIDLGCGEGKLLKELINKKEISKLTGVDVSYSQLQRAKRRLNEDELSDALSNKLELLQGSLTYIDARFKGYELATIIEVIEHLEKEQLYILEKNVFDNARPDYVIVTTPNKKYNETYGLTHETMRHNDHRFEWTEKEFQDWCILVAGRNDYFVEFKKIGEYIDGYGTPTQMGVFSRCR